MNPKLKQIIQQAGKIALKEQEKLKISIKPDSSIVTNGDLAVSEYLTTNLKKLYPNFDIFSEESSNQLPQFNNIIIIDPIDGTQSYSKKQDTWSILVGFIENGVITQGVVYQPTKQTIYYAKKSEGAFMEKNEKIIKLSSHKPLPLKGICSPNKNEEDIFLKNLSIDSVEYMYSASIKIMEVAMGKIDIYPNFAKKCSWWDLIAPQIILEEAGGSLILEEASDINFKDPHVNTRFICHGPNINSMNLFKK